MASKTCARVHYIRLSSFGNFSKSEQEKVIVTKITGFDLKNCSKSELRQNMGWAGRGGWGGGVKNGITSGRIGYFWPDGNLEGRRPALQAGKTRKWSSPAGNRRNRRNRRKSEGSGGRQRKQESRRKAKRGQRFLLGRSQVDPGNFARGSCKRLERLARWEMVPDAVDSVRRGRVYFPKMGENGRKILLGFERKVASC